MKLMLALCALALTGAAFGRDLPRPATKSDIAAIRDSLQDRLKDATSAQFRNVVKIGTDVCGEINAKNSYGAYVGFRTFAAGVLPADGGPVAMIIAIDDDDSNNASQFCSEKGM